MFKTFARDREYLENKYHRTDREFDPFNRYAYHGYEYDPGTGLDDARLSEGLTELFHRIKHLPHPVVKARCFAFALDNMRIDVNPHDYFVGFYSWNRPLAFIQNIWKAEEFGKNAERRQYNDLANDCNLSGAATVWPDFDHVIPDWEALMRLGFTGLRERVLRYRDLHMKNGSLDEKKKAHFDAMVIEYDAILRVIKRCRLYALAHRNEKTDVIVRALSTLENAAPGTTYEALLAIYIFFMLIEHVDGYQARSLGNGLDSTLYPFYLRDLAAGTPKDEILEYLAYFLMQFSAIGNYWGQPFYLGGTDMEGNTLVNDLSYDILRVHEAINIYNPKIQIKVSESTPDAFLEMVLERVKTGCGCFVFCCEPGFIQAMMSYGASYGEAVQFEISGCYETRVRGNEVSTGSYYINIAKAVLYALYNGYDTTIGKQMGVKTGGVDTFHTFDAFYHAFLKQIDNLVEICVSIGNHLYDPVLEVINPSPMYSATVEYSLEKGADAYSYGSKYNNSHILNSGFASAIDSLMAIKEFVYDKEEVTLAQMKDAVEKNWEGYEPLRRKILRSDRKFGNRDKETNMYSRALADYFAMRISNRPNARGGVYKPHMHSARQFIEQGRLTGATPDGRLAGEELSKNGSPVMGMDREGVTALIRSSLQLTPSHYTESFCLDVMLHPSTVAGDEGTDVMKKLIRVYMNGGGMAIQFNVFNAEMLRDAKENPDKYRNLQVRVCGWSVLWNNMSEEEQDAYIKRAENIQH